MGKKSVVNSQSIGCLFSKAQFLRSDKFRDFADIVSVCMSNDETISADDLQLRIDDFLKGRVI